MKKLITVSLAFLLSFAALTLYPSWAQDKDEPKPLHAVAPLEGVEPEMLSADYWISLHADADDVIMTPAEIVAFNERIRNQPVVFKERFGRRDPLIQNYAQKLAIGLYMHPIQPIELPDTMPGDSLRVWLKSDIDYLLSRDFYDSRNATYSDGMKQDLIDRINRGGVPDVIKRRWGVIIKRADMRMFPTAAAGFSETKWEMDMFQTTGVYIINPVAILYESIDSDFYYVQTPIARGWMSADRIALADRKAVRKLIGDDFIMATGDRVPVYADPDFSTFDRYFYMSATLPKNKVTDKAYILNLPYRKTDGTLGITKGYIKPDADVHEGYLPYTKRNVLTQIFKLHGTPYGWGDQFNKRDCSGAQRVVIRCFGITTGRWPNFVLLASDHRTYIDQKLSEEEKIEQVSKIEGCVTWTGSGGHLVYFLGKAKNGKVYYMHQGGWGFDEGDQHYIVNRVEINEAHHKWYNVNSARVYTTMRK